MQAFNKARRAWRGRALAMGICACALVACLSGCGFMGPSGPGPEPEPIKAMLTGDDLVNEGYLTVAMDTTDAPQAMVDADGSAIGYYADVARALAERLGLGLKVVSSADAGEAISEGEVDAYIGHKLSDTDEELLLTEAIVEDASSIFARNADGSTEAPTLDADSLANAAIAVQGDSASQDILNRAGIKAELKTFANVNECFEALDAGDVEYVVCDATAGAYLARTYPGAVFVATVGAPSSFGIAMPAANGNLTREVGNVFDGLVSGGILDAIHRSWYGSLPLGLSGARLAGLALPASTASADQGASGAAAAKEDGGLTINGDLNSLG